MALIESIKKVKKNRLKLIFAIIFLYTAIHFAYSGVYFPAVHAEKIGQVEEEIVPLAGFLNGGKFIFDNPRQYGPFFIMVMTPFMIFHADKTVFASALLAFGYLLTVLAFCICYKYIFQPDGKEEKRIVFWLLLFLWANFAPLLYITTVRNIEIWELFLICLGFLMYAKRKYFWTGLSFAAAALTKMLPAIFIFYFLFKNRKVFFYSVLSILSIVVLANFIYGPNIGILYLPFLVTRAVGSKTWAVTFFENTSLKGFVYKLFGGFRTGSSYAFLLSPQGEKFAFIAVTIFQVLILSYLICMALKKNVGKEEEMVQFSLVSIAMIILAPIAALEYSTLLLFAYSAGLYLVLYKDLPKYMYLLYGLSYLLIGSFIPLSVLVKAFPFRAINAALGNTKFDMAESYKAYCIPLFGFILIALFFGLYRAWNNKKLKVANIAK